MPINPIITREWSMPNSCTFSIKPIYNLINSLIQPTHKICDPFVNNSPFKKICITNDLDNDIEADYHMDALDFLKTRESEEFDLILFDPPYSPRQVSECYKKLGKTVNMQTTQSIFWSDLKKEIQRITKANGTVLTCGWNSGGIGIKYGFSIEKIMIVAHGGWHNDTIATIEKKSIKQNTGLF